MSVTVSLRGEDNASCVLVWCFWHSARTVAFSVESTANF